MAHTVIIPAYFANGNSSHRRRPPLTCLRVPPMLISVETQGIIDHLDYLQELELQEVYRPTLLNRRAKSYKYDNYRHFEIDRNILVIGDLPPAGEKRPTRRGMKTMRMPSSTILATDSPQWQDVVKHGRIRRLVPY